MSDTTATSSIATGTAATEDVARAETDIALHADALFEFVRDVERLFRLNPHLEIEHWQAGATGFRLAAANETNERRIETVASVEVVAATRTISISYDAGLKRETRITAEPDAAGSGSRLVVTEHYPAIEDLQDPRLAEADRSLIPWVAAIRRHLLQRKRWGSWPGWTWWNERFMAGMAPRQRRIVRMIIWVSVLEFLVFLALAAVLVASL